MLLHLKAVTPSNNLRRVLLTLSVLITLSQQRCDSRMPMCANCESYVTRDFIRVFGVDGDVYGCPHCTTYSELQDGSGAESSQKKTS